MIKWRYYYQKYGELVTSDNMPSDLVADIPKLTIAALSCGTENQRSIGRTINFFVQQNCLVRVPVFVDSQGRESEVQSNDYVLYKFGSNIASGLSPTQGAEIITSSIIDGFDIMPLIGGIGFAEHIPYVLEHVTQNPDLFIDKPKVRLFGFSDNSMAVMLKDLVQFIAYDTATMVNADRHSTKNAKESDATALEIITKKSDFLPKRKAIPHNQLAHNLCAEPSLSDFTCYPFVFYFFDNFAQSIFPFVPGQDEKYSLMLDQVIYYFHPKDAKQYCASLRNFLENLKRQNLPLPFAIEIGDAIHHFFFLLPHENGLLLSPSQVREKYGEAKYQLFKKHIAQSFKKNPENFSDEEAEELIKTKIHPFYQEYLDEVTKIADNFQILVFVGGAKRFGHSDHSSLQPSASINKAELKQDESGQKYFEFTSELAAAHPNISRESIERLKDHKGKVNELAFETRLEGVLESNPLKLKVSPINKVSSRYKIGNIQIAELQTIHSARKTDHDHTRLCVIQSPILDSDKHKILTYLQSSLLSGRITGVVTESNFAIDQTPIIFAIAHNTQKDNQRFKQDKTTFENIVIKFCEQHQIITPIYISNAPFHNPQKSQSNGAIANFQPNLNQAFAVSVSITSSRFKDNPAAIIMKANERRLLENIRKYFKRD